MQTFFGGMPAARFRVAFELKLGKQAIRPIGRRRRTSERGLRTSRGRYSSRRMNATNYELAGSYLLPGYILTWACMSLLNSIEAVYVRPLSRLLLPTSYMRHEGSLWCMERALS